MGFSRKDAKAQKCKEILASSLEKGASYFLSMCFPSIPKGLHHSAQGSAERATLGGMFENSPNPARGCIKFGPALDATLCRVGDVERLPQGSPLRGQPWA